MIKSIGIVLAGLLIFIFSIFYAYGIFKPIRIVEKNAGPYYIVYKKHIGNYSKVASVFDQMENELFKKFGYKGRVGVGFYFDKPGKVENSKLRSLIGYVVDSTTYNKITGYKKVIFPKSRAITTEFLLRTRLSILIGAFKIYPKLSKVIEKKNIDKKEFAIVEIYNNPKKLIEYVAPVNVDDSIFVNMLK